MPSWIDWSETDFFSNLQYTSHSTLEPIPGLGAVYSFRRVFISGERGDNGSFVKSLMNFTKGAVRDAVLVADTVEPLPIFVIQIMTESMTDTLFDVFTSVQKSPGISVSPAYLSRLRSRLEPNDIPLLIASDRNYKLPDCQVLYDLFDSKSKSVHHFYRTVFKGRLTQKTYASEGEDIWFRLPEGFRDGAPCSFFWKRARCDTLPPQRNRPEQTHSRLVMHYDNGRTHFSLEDTTASYNFTGSIENSSLLRVCMHMGNEDVHIDMRPIGAHYQIVPVNAPGMNLNLWGNSDQPRTPVKLYPGRPLTDNALWEIVDAGRGEHHIVSVSAGLYLCADEDENIGEAVFGGFTRPDFNNCRWKITPAGNGSYYITSVNKEYYLNVAGGASDEGTDLIIWSPETGANSQFMLKMPA